MTVGDLYEKAFGLPCADPDVALVVMDSDLGGRCEYFIASTEFFLHTLDERKNNWSPDRNRRILLPVLAGLTAHLQDLLHG